MFEDIELPPISAEELEQAFPGGFNLRDEANAITVYAFRNNETLENLHCGKSSPLLDDPTLCRITDDEMKQLMIKASGRVEQLLRMKETDPDEYWLTIHDSALRYCRRWQRNP